MKSKLSAMFHTFFIWQSVLKVKTISVGIRGCSPQNIMANLLRPYIIYVFNLYFIHPYLEVKTLSAYQINIIYIIMQDIIINKQKSEGTSTRWFGWRLLLSFWWAFRATREELFKALGWFAVDTSPWVNEILPWCQQGSSQTFIFHKACGCLEKWNHWNKRNHESELNDRMECWHASSFIWQSNSQIKQKLC